MPLKQGYSSFISPEKVSLNPWVQLYVATQHPVSETISNHFNVQQLPRVIRKLLKETHGSVPHTSRALGIFRTGTPRQRLCLEALGPLFCVPIRPGASWERPSCKSCPGRGFGHHGLAPRFCFVWLSFLRMDTYMMFKEARTP